VKRLIDDRQERAKDGLPFVCRDFTDGEGWMLTLYSGCLKDIITGQTDPSNRTENKP